MDIQHEQRKFILAHLDHMSDNLRAMYLSQQWIQAALHQQKGKTTMDKTQGMTKEQIRHAQAMARKVKEHAKRIVASMEQLESASFSDLQHVPVNNVVNRFGHDMGYGLVDYIDTINRVVSDMLPELTSQDETEKE